MVKGYEVKFLKKKQMPYEKFFAKFKEVHRKYKDEYRFLKVGVKNSKPYIHFYINEDECILTVQYDEILKVFGVKGLVHNVSTNVNWVDKSNKIKEDLLFGLYQVERTEKKSEAVSVIELEYY